MSLPKAPRISGNDVLTARKELQTRYFETSTSIRMIWTNYSTQEREHFLTTFCAKEGLIHLLPAMKRTDELMLHRLSPDLVIKDLTIEDSLFTLMNALATTSLSERLHLDLAIVLKSIKDHNLIHPHARAGMRMVFENGGNWGKVLETRSEPQAFKNDKDIDNSIAAQENGLFTSENVGLLMIERQLHLYKFFISVTKYLQALVVIGSFGKQDPDSKASSNSGTNGDNGNSVMATRGSKSAALVTMDAKFTDIIAEAQAALLSARDHVHFLCNDPLYLHSCVNDFYLSHSINHPDAMFIKKNSNPVITASAAVLNFLNNAHSTFSSWNYIYLLLTSRIVLTDPARIWYTASKELNRTRGRFRWFLVTDPKYAKYYTAVNQRDLSSKGPPILKLKKKLLVNLQRKSELTMWMLSLADAMLTPKDVARLLKEINECIDSVPQARENISEKLGDALANISVISMFMERCESLWGLPKLTSAPIYTVPKNNMSSETWKTLEWASWYFPKFDLKGDQVKTTEDFARIAYACINEMLSNQEEGLSALQGISLGLFRPVEFEGRQFESTNLTSKKKVPSITSGASLSSHGTRAPTILVTASALKSLRKIFRAELDGTVTWPAFEYAMTEAGFTVERHTSLARIIPKDLKNGWKQINLYRPYPNDRFAGWTLFKLKLKLARNYEWDDSTFALEKK